MGFRITDTSLLLADTLLPILTPIHSVLRPITLATLEVLDARINVKAPCSRFVASHFIVRQGSTGYSSDLGSFTLFDSAVNSHAISSGEAAW